MWRANSSHARTTSVMFNISSFCRTSSFILWPNWLSPASVLGSLAYAASNLIFIGQSPSNTPGSIQQNWSVQSFININFTWKLYFIQRSYYSYLTDRANWFVEKLTSRRSSTLLSISWKICYLLSLIYPPAVVLLGSIQSTLPCKMSFFPFPESLPIMKPRTEGLFHRKKDV